MWSGIECLSDAFGWGKRMKAGMAGRVFATLTTEPRARLVRQVKKSLGEQAGGGNTNIALVSGSGHVVRTLPG